MYTTRNFKSDKALRKAFKAGELLEVYQPGGIFSSVVKDGWGVVEGPQVLRAGRGEGRSDS